MAKFNDYYTPMEHDEPPPYTECEDCGESYPTHEMVNMKCQICNSEIVDAENLECAKEHFGSAILAKMVQSKQAVGTILGTLSQYIIDHATEKQLDDLREQINNIK